MTYVHRAGFTYVLVAGKHATSEERKAFKVISARAPSTSDLT